MNTIYIEIPLPPKTKKNHQRILMNKRTGSRFVSPSEQYKTYERDCGWFIQAPESPITFPVNVRCIFYMPDKRRCDLTNLEESIDDILVKYGVLADDNYNIIAGHDGSRVRIDREHPRTEIYIEALKEFEEVPIPRNALWLSDSREDGVPLDFPNG